jgi:hypothetical protein
MADWKLKKRTAGCARCERAFLDEEPFFSVLSIDAAELQRADVCRACFPGMQVQAAEAWIFWRSRHRLEKRRFAVDFEALEGLFLALEGRAEPALRELRYLLALLLMRKKRLKLVKTARREDGEAMLLRRPRRTEELCVHVFDLSAERAELLRSKLRAIFEGAELEELLPAPAQESPEAS